MDDFGRTGGADLGRFLLSSTRSLKAIVIETPDM